MKTYCIIRTSEQFPWEARTMLVKGFDNALKVMESYVYRDRYFFDKRCAILHNRNRKCYTVIDCTSQGRITTRIVRYASEIPIIANR